MRWRAVLMLFFSLSLSSHPADAKKVVIITSGGVSLGAYEAGLNWALVELFKAGKNTPPGPATPAAPDTHTIVGLTGASAGAINTLLGTLTWCQAEETSITGNLFWQAWIPIGVDIQFPQNIPAEEYQARYGNLFRGIDGKAADGLRLAGGSDYPAYHKDGNGKDRDGLLTRKASEYITNKITAQIDGWEKNGVPGPSQCNLALGFTLTRFDPLELKVAGIKTSTQKFFVPLNIRTADGKLVIDNQKELFPPISTASTTPLPGHPIQLPYDNREDTLGTTAKAPASVATKALTEAIRASAAFPVAFDPVSLSYCDTEDERRNGHTPLYTCLEGRHLNSAEFSDGGLFNNVPIGLAVVQQVAGTGGQTPKPDMANLSFIVISPNERSSLPADAADANAPQGEENSLEKTWGRFFTNAANTAMEAETVTALTIPHIEEHIHATKRFSPITGAYLAHFGAFFDRPFREYDFHAGVYDAIREYAILRCAALRPGAETTYHQCIGDRMEESLRSLHLLPDGAPDTPAPLLDARFVVGGLATREFSGHMGAWPWLDKYGQTKPDNYNLKIIQDTLFGCERKDEACNPTERKDAKYENNFQNFIKALDKAGYVDVNPYTDLKPAPRPNKCALTADEAENLKEPNWLISTYNYVTSTSYSLTFKGYIDFSNSVYVCNPSEECKDRCYAMQTSLKDLRSNYDSWIVRNSIATVQRAKWKDAQENHSGEKKVDIKLLNGTEFILRNNSDAFDYNVLRLNASSVPENRPEIDNWLFNDFFKLIPYRVGMNTTDGGWILGYEPNLRFNKTWDLTFPVTPYSSANSLNKTFMDAGILVGYHTQRMSDLSLRAGVAQYYEWRSTLDVRETENIGARVELGFLWNKVSLSITQRNYLDPDTRFYTINFNDINGLIYWALKIRE